MRTAALIFVIAALPPAIAMADLVRPLCRPEPAEAIPLTTAAMVGLMVGPLVHHGVSLLLVGAVAMVGIPWTIAGAAMFLADLTSRFRTRSRG